MADLYFNDLTITARREVLDDILAYATAETLWAVAPELDPSNVIDDGHQLCYRYDTKGGRSVEMVERLAKLFPEALVLLTFQNNNTACYGHLVYAEGRELRCEVFQGSV